MIKHIMAGNEVYVCIVTKGSRPLFSLELIEQGRTEARLCHRRLGIKKTFFLDFPAAMMEKAERYEINDKILKVIKDVAPDEVYIPHWGDMQKDHQIVAEACMVALRPKYEPKVKKIYGYETMSETAWNAPNIQNEFIPNAFVDISEELDKKLLALSMYQSQMNRFPDARSVEAVEALAKYRGALMHVSAAEAFMVLREIRDILA